MPVVAASLSCIMKQSVMACSSGLHMMWSSQRDSEGLKTGVNGNGALASMGEVLRSDLKKKAVSKIKDQQWPLNPQRASSVLISSDELIRWISNWLLELMSTKATIVLSYRK